jgi:proline racemase
MALFGIGCRAAGSVVAEVVGGRTRLAGPPLARRRSEVNRFKRTLRLVMLPRR